MKLTVGIPVFNEEANIKYLIESVLKYGQQYNIELIVVSSGSTDQTNSIVRSFGKVKLIIEDERLGKMSAIDKIIIYANGEYILFIDGDVCIDAELFQTLFNFIINNKPFAVAGQVNCIGKNSFFDRLGILSCNAWHNVRMQAENNSTFVYPSGYCMLIRAEVLKSLALKVDIINDDVFFGLSLYNIGYRFKYLPAAIVYIKVPQNIKDFFNQKVRTRLGRRIIRNQLVISKVEKIWRKNVLRQTRVSNIHLVSSLLLLDLICRMIATTQYHLGYSSNLWVSIPSTKRINNDD